MAKGLNWYESFTELARHKKEGEDYAVVVRNVAGSKISIVAPHGDRIEPHTADMARAIAAGDYSLYIFSNINPGNVYREMHIASVSFDEPRCLDLVAGTETTLTIHGSKIKEPAVFISAMDKKLQSRLTVAFNKAGIRAEVENHPYQTGTKPENICNRNSRGKGVQIEFSRGLRDDAQMRETCVRVIRETLKNYRP